MLVSEFLALVPGPKALVGALISSKPGRRSSSLRIDGTESIGLLMTEMADWHVVERPPLYQDPSARYCGWCKSRLYTGYRPAEGLVEGWCSDHGPHAKVLHDTDAQDKRYIDTLAKVKKLEPELEKKMVDVVPGTTTGPRKEVVEVAKAPPEKKLTEAQVAFVKNLGFESIDEFKRLAGVKR